MTRTHTFSCRSPDASGTMRCSSNVRHWAALLIVVAATSLASCRGEPERRDPETPSPAPVTSADSSSRLEGVFVGQAQDGQGWLLIFDSTTGDARAMRDPGDVVGACTVVEGADGSVSFGLGFGPPNAPWTFRGDLRGDVLAGTLESEALAGRARQTWTLRLTRVTPARDVHGTGLADGLYSNVRYGADSENPRGWAMLVVRAADSTLGVPLTFGAPRSELRGPRRLVTAAEIIRGGGFVGIIRGDTIITEGDTLLRTKSIEELLAQPVRRCQIDARHPR